MKIALVVLILAGLAEIVYLYRERIKEWLPGIKAYIWNGIIAAAGVLGPILDYLGKVDLNGVLTKENAALAAIVIGVVGILISIVTKRSDESA